MNKFTLFFLLLFMGKFNTAHAFPSVCSVVNSPSFNSCLQLRVSSPYLCNVLPPKFCVNISYRVPQIYAEVVSNPRESFFTGLPGASVQLATIKDVVPFGAEADNGTYSFHAHTANVPFTMIGFRGLPCGGAPIDNMCFTSMSEHLGDLWRTGSADTLQPSFLAWSLAPKACLIKGAVTSATGDSRPTGYPNSNMCSFDRSWMRKFPPSNHAVCNGWGLFFPRSGAVTSSDQTTASAMIASRIKSLGSEVFQSVPSSFNEKFQMISPQGSSCFGEGQNVAILRAKRVSEWGRITNGKFKNYLYSTWKQVSCVRDVSQAIPTKLWPGILKAACAGLK